MTIASPKARAQTKAIRGSVKEDYSANQIQVKLREQHIGMRRKILLTRALPCHIVENNLNQLTCLLGAMSYSRYEVVTRQILKQALL